MRIGLQKKMDEEIDRKIERVKKETTDLLKRKLGAILLKYGQKGEVDVNVWIDTEIRTNY